MQQLPRTAAVHSCYSQLPTQTDHNIDSYADLMVEARKHKGLQRDIARDSLQDPNVFGTAMVLAGHADGMVSGSINTTAATIRWVVVWGDGGGCCS